MPHNGSTCVQVLLQEQVATHLPHVANREVVSQLNVSSGPIFVKKQSTEELGSAGFSFKLYIKKIIPDFHQKSPVGLEKHL